MPFGGAGTLGVRGDVIGTLRQRFVPCEEVWGFQPDSGDGLCHTSGECLADRLSLTLDGLAMPAVDHSQYGTPSVEGNAS
jgi:hypothetical protein